LAFLADVVLKLGKPIILWLLGLPLVLVVALYLLNVI